MSVIDQNRIPQLRERIKDLTSRTVKVGILGESDSEMAMIAKVNEYGTKIKITEKMRNYLHFLGFHLSKKTEHIVIPERAFLRKSFDDKKNKDKVSDYAKDIFDFNFSVKKICNRVGVFMTGAIQEKIKSNLKPGNHPFTIRQKDGKNRTLVNTGRLGQAISHKVE